MKINEFQEFVIDIFWSTIKTCKEQAFSETAFLTGAKALKGLINHYASMYRTKDSYKNLWQLEKFESFAPLLMSENAFHIYKNNEDKGSYKKYKDAHKDKLDKLLFWEHITPNDIIWKRILNVYHDYMAGTISEDSVLKQKIAECFCGHRLLLITKAEQEELDSKGGRTGQKKSIYDNPQNPLQMAEGRIQVLFSDCKVNRLYLNNEVLNPSDIFDKSGNFIGKVKKYFTNDYFVID